MNVKLKGILYTFASAASISVTFIASKQALLELHPLGFSPIWFALATAWGLGYYAIQPTKIPWPTLKPHFMALVLLGLFSSAANFFLFSSVQLGDPTVVAFFSRSETVFSLLWGVVFLKEHLTKVQWLGAMTAIIGAGIMTYQGETIIWIVLLLAIAANFFNATSSYVAKRNIINISPAVLGLARTIILTLTLGIIGLLAGKLAWPSLRTLLWIIGGSFVGPFLSYIFFYKGLAYIDMGQAAIIRATQPLFVAVYSLALFGRTIGIVQFAGGLVISIGVFMMLSKGASKQIFSLANPLLIFIQRRTTNRK